MKKNKKLILGVLMFSGIVLTPAILVSCVDNRATNPNNNNQSLTPSNSEKTNNQDTGKINNNSPTSSKPNIGNIEQEGSQTPNNPNVEEQKSDSPKAPDTQDSGKKQEEELKSPSSPDAGQSQPESPQNPSTPNSEDKDQKPEEPQAPDKSKDENQMLGESQTPDTPNVEDTQPEAPQSPNPEEPNNSEENMDSNSDKEKESKPKWWEKSENAPVELLNIISDGENLWLNFKDAFSEKISSTLTLKKEGNNEEKQINFETEKSRIQKNSLKDLQTGKWKISQIKFNASSYTPTLDGSFDYKSSFEEYNRIKEILTSLNFSVKEEKKHILSFSEMKSSDFNLGLLAKEGNDVFGFPKETLESKEISDIDMQITFSPIKDDAVGEKRNGKFKIEFLNQSLLFETIEKNIEWKYKTAEKIMEDFAKGKERYIELENYLLNHYFKDKANIHPFMLKDLTTNVDGKQVKIADNKINLKDGVVATLKGSKGVNDYQGSATLIFEVDRYGSKKQVEITINDFAKVAFHEENYGGNKRLQDFDIRASSNWPGYPAALAFTTYAWKKHYWSAKKGDRNPWLEFGWKNGKRDTIYGLELLFWKGDDRYYKKDAYKIQYRETANGPWKNLNIYPKKAQEVFKKDFNYRRDLIEIKKANINAVRIVFVDGLKPVWPSIFSLMPITKVTKK
ncbi:hypothetical protein [Mycoplasmopsis pulmonis]|nr:hypothetical protein [Mycoplasmopsis pulmonis]